MDVTPEDQRVTGHPSEPPPRTGPPYSARHPFLAEVLRSERLSGAGSTLDLRHVELDLEGSGLSYLPGDSVGIIPSNDPSYVDQLLELLGLESDTEVETAVGRLALGRALGDVYEIRIPTRSQLKRYAALGADPGLYELLRPERRKELQAYVSERELLDVVREFPVGSMSAADLAETLRPMAPRLYSVASSADAFPGRAHILFKVVRYRSLERERRGVCTGFLGDRIEAGDRIPIYVHTNPTFRLPADSSVPIIMVGPGTGVAAFRAFLQQREVDRARGGAWLFYGSRNAATDFVYQADWTALQKSGALTRLDAAFSQDGTEARYVQHLMRQSSRELFAWLERGAAFYVCGDAERMGPDVLAELEALVARESGRSAEWSAEYVAALRRERRYQHDLY